MNAGWYVDPTSRFPARYFDGTDWTDQVQQADGQVTADAMERRSSGFPAPAPTPASALAPAMPASTVPSWGAPPPASSPRLDRSTGTAGLVLAGLGWLLALLSYVALDWVDGASRPDLSDALPSSLPDAAPLADHLSFAYLGWAGLALAVAVGVGLVVALITLRGSDPTAVRVLVAALAAIAAVLQAVTVVRVLGDQAELGAQLGIVAYLVVVVGLAVGSRTRPATG